MPQLQLKPLTVNRAYQGRRFKTKEHQAYSFQVMSLLPKLELPNPPFHISFVFGMSSILSDVDNPIKPFMDCLQRKYGFNDNVVYKITAEKEKVKKGNEFVRFEIKGY